MSHPDSTVILSTDECWELLRRNTVGRLAVDIAGKPDIFPINYLVDDGAILFRSGAGTKLAAAALLHHVAFEIDGYEPGERVAWSVVIKGKAHQVERMEDVFAAEELPLFPWLASPKPNFVRIAPDDISGRRFHIVDDVSPDASLGWTPTETAETDSGAADSAVAPEPGSEYHPGAPNVRPG